MKRYKIPNEVLYGIKELDDQHQELVDTVRSLDAHVGSDDIATIEKIFDHLEKLMIKHFSDEESIMKETEFPDVAAHSVHHKKLLEEARQIFSIAVSRGTLSEHDINESIDKILRHLLLADAPFNTHLRQTQHV